MENKKILMLCLGNICRSPLAEGLLQSKADAYGFNWNVESAGIGHWHIGKLPDERSIKVAKANGLDITNQRARRFEVSDFDKYDLIYAMDNKNLHYLKLLSRCEADMAKVHLIMDELYPKSGKCLPDPFHEGKENFELVYHTLDQATNVMIAKATPLGHVKRAA